MCVFFFCRDLNLPLQSNPRLQSCLEYTLLPCWYLSFCSLLFPFFSMPFPSSSADLTVLTYALHFQHHCIHSAFFSSFILVSFMSSLAVCAAVDVTSSSFSLHLCLSLTAHVAVMIITYYFRTLSHLTYSLSLLRPCPLKQLTENPHFHVDFPLSWIKCAWQTVVRPGKESLFISHFIHNGNWKCFTLKEVKK